MSQLTHGSLFAGIGGFDLGFERAGIKTIWQVEIDEYCRRVLARHFPDAERFSDVRECGAHNLKRVDIICGGFPCQPFSSASRGRCEGERDNRYLWPEMLRVIGERNPTWVCVENVTHIDRTVLEKMVFDLEAISYEVAPTLEVPACAFGHDHRRSRLWILGYSNSNRQSGRSVDAEVAELPKYGTNYSRIMGAAHGVPSRMDRLTALGNAVVPQIAEWIGRRIVEATEAVND